MDRRRPGPEPDPPGSPSDEKVPYPGSGRAPVVPHLDAMDRPYTPVASVCAPWAKARAFAGCSALRGEAGEKLIRRSMASLVRKRIGEERWRQGERMLGHIKASVNDIYAVPDPANLDLALAATKAIIDEIEALRPGAYRTFAALKVVNGGLSR